MTHRLSNRVVLVLIGSLVGCQLAVADWKEDIGFTLLQTELALASDPLPTGAGVPVAMGEAGTVSPVPPATPTTFTYMPNLASPQFSGKTVVASSESNTGFNTHANDVAGFFFGNTASISPGVDQVKVYRAVPWLINSLGAGVGVEPISHADVRIINHSWVVQPAAVSDADAVTLSQYVDHLANRDNVLIIAGTDNSGSLPKLLAHSYNAISVGITSGTHASGPTTLYGSGRPRPDIVAPAAFTSYATPMVSSAAALLSDYADNSIATMSATQAETMRAILMAGATKTEFATWDRTPTRPIDEIYGAGELNVYNSYRIIEGGETDGTIVTPVTPAGLFGYDTVLQPDFTAPLNYRFDVASGTVLSELSIFLQWQIDVADANPSPSGFSPLVDLSPGESLANLRLDFFDASDTLLDFSDSAIDNFEHLYFTDLAAGTYRLQVSGDRADTFGLAWRGIATAIPEPASWAIIVFGGTLAWARRRRRGPPPLTT